MAIEAMSKNRHFTALHSCPREIKQPHSSTIGTPTDGDEAVLLVLTAAAVDQQIVDYLCETELPSSSR